MLALTAWGAVIGWVIWPAFFLWLHLRQRRSSGLSDAEIQAASRVGHLPRRQAGPTARRVPPPGLWIRGTLGMLCAIPVVIVGLINSIFGVAVISGWIQTALDNLYAFARGSVDAFLADARSEEPVITPWRRRPIQGCGRFRCAVTCSAGAKFAYRCFSR
jgi:hypothetical protein